MNIRAHALQKHAQAVRKFIPTIIFAFTFVFMLTSCNEQLAPPAATPAPTATPVPGGTEPAVRIIFNTTSFTNLDTFNGQSLTTQTGCPGDLVRAYYVTGGGYNFNASGSYDTAQAQIPFPTQSEADDLSPTYKPTFLKNVGVDITNSYYIESATSYISSDACTYRDTPNAALPNVCADFDRTPAGVSADHLAAIMPTPSPTPDSTPFFETGFYRVRDDWCQYQGPTISPDIETTKAHIGGVNIDLDRSSLNAHEDLLMNITYHSFDNNREGWPLAAGHVQGNHDHTVLNVQMIGTSQSLSTLLGVKQPRAWGYFESPSFPVYQKDLETLDDPYGSIRTEQIYVPLSRYPLVDRIRIERVRGTYYLYQVDLYRLGERSETIE